MSGRVAGKVALVTAAGQGIGRASALALAREGARVFAADLHADPVHALAQEHAGIDGIQLDVRDPQAIRAAAERIGALDVLFNCVGFVHHGSILECSEEDWDLSFDVNVKSMYRMIRAFLPAMLESGGGSIINMSSIASSIRAAPNRFAYGATKAAVIGLTKGIAADFVKSGIRCNAICPGTIETPSLRERIAAQGDVERTRAEFIARQPMGRLGVPEEIASIVVHLASDESGYTTGTYFVADGGWNI